MGAGDCGGTVTKAGCRGCLLRDRKKGGENGKRHRNGRLELLFEDAFRKSGEKNRIRPPGSRNGR